MRNRLSCRPGSLSRAAVLPTRSGLFLRAKTRKKDGKEHRYWRVVENRRVADGRVVQRPVLSLGAINDVQRAAWCRSIAVFDEDTGIATPLALFPEDRPAPALAGAVVQVKLSQRPRRRPRQGGACWLACGLWELLPLDTCWQPRMPPSRQGTRGLNVLKTLVAYRLIDPGSEWRRHRHGFDPSARGDRLGEDFAIAHRHTLYRGLDHRVAPKKALFSPLQARWRRLFEARFDLLLYDLTSTYCECDPPDHGQRQFGYRRDQRSAGVPVVIALIVTPDGFPLAYEVLAGKTLDQQTLTDALAKIAAQYGQADRIGVTARGLPTEETLALRRASDPPVHYLVGTPKGRLTPLEKAFLTKPWAAVREPVTVQLLDQDGELYVLARRAGRHDQERAMRQHRLKRLGKRRQALQRQDLSRDDR